MALSDMRRSFSSPVWGWFGNVRAKCREVAKIPCHPVRAAARSAAAQTRYPCGVRLVFRVAARLGPGTAGQHFVLRRIRDDIQGVKAKTPCHPVRAAARSAAAQTRYPCGVGWCSGWWHVWVPEQRSSTACCAASGMTSRGLKQKCIVIPCALRRGVPLRRHGTHAGFGWCSGWWHAWVPGQRGSTSCCAASGMTR
jgi:hypothetical protein